MENICTEREPESYNTLEGVVTVEEMKRRKDDEQDKQRRVCDKKWCNQSSY